MLVKQQSRHKKFKKGHKKYKKIHATRHQLENKEYQYYLNMSNLNKPMVCICLQEQQQIAGSENGPSPASTVEACY